jgi:hypothetical protein
LSGTSNNGAQLPHASDPNPPNEQRLLSQQLFKQAAPSIDLSQPSVINDADKKYSDMNILINYTYYVLKDFSENNLLTVPEDRSEVS